MWCRFINKFFFLLSSKWNNFDLLKGGADVVTTYIMQRSTSSSVEDDVESSNTVIRKDEYNIESVSSSKNDSYASQQAAKYGDNLIVVRRDSSGNVMFFVS